MLEITQLVNSGVRIQTRQLDFRVPYFIYHYAVLPLLKSKRKKKNVFDVSDLKINHGYITNPLNGLIGPGQANSHTEVNCRADKGGGR